jgi:type IV secretion system protein TrbH
MKRSVIALLAVVLTGCANSQYGVYTPLDTANSARLAIDASNVLPRAYAPSVTRFNVKQDTSEAFGSTLVLLLRQKGYAVAENPQFWRSIYPAPKAPGFSFNYVIDQVSDDQTRLTLMVEGSSISRLYRMVNGVAVPVGFWAKKD